MKIVTWKLATFFKTKPNLRGTHTCTLAMTELSASKFGLMSMKVLLRFFQLESISKNPTSSCYSCVELQSMHFLDNKINKSFKKPVPLSNDYKKTWYVDVKFMLPCSEMVTGLMDFQFSSSKPLKRCLT